MNPHGTAGGSAAEHVTTPVAPKPRRPDARRRPAAPPPGPYASGLPAPQVPAPQLPAPPSPGPRSPAARPKVTPERGNWLGRVDPFAWFAIGSMILGAGLLAFGGAATWAASLVFVAVVILVLEAAVFGKPATPEPGGRAPMGPGRPMPGGQRIPVR